MRRTAVVVALAVVVTVTAGCSGTGGTSTTAAPRTSPEPMSAGPHTALQAADAALIASMYSTITRAFALTPDDGVRAVVAAQYPGDRRAVSFARCVNAILPGAKTLPSSKRFDFVPNLATMTPDPGYTLPSRGVSILRPKGRIYVTDVTTIAGGRSTVHQRHQVVRDGKAYQFSSC
ncbi:MAG: hypothetical protein JWM02_134 [Frankiales bacterium]|nr:hypothetical protein [Frankiales bacterium]